MPFSAPEPPQRLLTRDFVKLVLTQMAFGYAISTFMLLPKFLATQLHGNAAEIGHVNAIPGLIAALLVPFVGGALDRFGRKPLLQLGSALGVVYALLWLTVDRVGPAVYGLQVLCGAAFMLTFSGTSTLVADAAPPARLGQAIGIFGAANISMNALAPGVAEPLAERMGWWIAFALAAGMFALAFLLSFRLREQRRAAVPASAGDLRDTLIVARRLFPYIAAMLSCGAAFGASFTFYQPYVLAQGADHVSSFFVGFMLAAVGTRLGLGGVADRVGRRRVALIALTAYACMVLAMVQLTPERLLLFGFGFGLAHGFFFPALNAYALEFTAPHERGRAMTLVNGSFHLGNTTSLLCCGYVANTYGYPLAFALAASIAGLGVCALHWDQLLSTRLLAVRSQV